MAAVCSAGHLPSDASFRIASALRVSNHSDHTLWKTPSTLKVTSRPKSRKRKTPLRDSTGLSSEESRISSGLYLLFVLFLQTVGFSKWAMLDSNQRPPLCKLGQIFPGRYCPVGKSRVNERFCRFLRRRFPVLSGRVLLRLQHTYLLPELGEQTAATTETGFWFTFSKLRDKTTI